MNVNLVNPLVLAYIGDAIYELKIRSMLVYSKINKVNDLQKECTKYVSAKGQAYYIDKLINNNILNDVEVDAKVNSHPSNTDIITYKCATGLEAIFGYLYLTCSYERIDELVKYIKEN